MTFFVVAVAEKVSQDFQFVTYFKDMQKHYTKPKTRDSAKRLLVAVVCIFNDSQMYYLLDMFLIYKPNKFQTLSVKYHFLSQYI